MFDAQTIQLQGTGSANPSTVVYSPWFSRGGDYGIFTLEVIKMSGTTSAFKLKVEFVHKNTSDTGDGGNPIASTDITIDGSESPTREQKDVTAGFKELVRYKYTLTTTDSPATTTTMWAVFRMLSPVWYDKV